MESNNIIAAPGVADAAGLYDIWRVDHTGSLSTFYEFMTTPTPEREEFLLSVKSRISRRFNGNVVETVIA